MGTVLSDQIANIIGTYQFQYNSDGSIVYGLSALDYPYILRAILLIVAIHGVMMLLISLTKSFRGL